MEACAAKNLKLVPFENFIGDDPVISYVGIRGDENREGYISTKSNIQSIFHHIICFINHRHYTQNSSLLNKKNV